MGRLNEFTPKTIINKEFSITLKNYLELFGYQSENVVENAVCIVWTNIFPKKSKELIKLIYNSLENNKDKKISIYLINIDRVYL